MTRKYWTGKALVRSLTLEAVYEKSHRAFAGVAVWSKVSSLSFHHTAASSSLTFIACFDQTGLRPYNRVTHAKGPHVPSNPAPVYLVDLTLKRGSTWKVATFSNAPDYSGYCG